MPSTFVIFTDLDGTLLDHRSYSFEAALPALRLIELKRIPLVICTSKTRAEIEVYRKLLGNREPFISENGGGIFIPYDYFSRRFPYDKESDGYKIIELGTPHETLVEALKSIERDTGVGVRGLSDMTTEELSAVSGLSKELAEPARRREYDEPFIVQGNEDSRERIKREIIGRGFNHTEGGIFHHIMGENDKGKAAKLLIKLFEKEVSELKTVAIGDSFNDFPMLEAVDTPILVQKPDGRYDGRIKLDNLFLAEGIGPEGWNRSILKLLEN